MNNKISNIKILIKAVLVMGVVLVASAGSLKASVLKIDATGIDVKSAAGVSFTTGNYGAKLGFFQSGFTATSGNLALWDENFISMNGSWGASAKRFQVSLTAGDGNVGGGSQSGTTAFGVSIPVNTPLYLLVSNVAANSAGNTSSAANADYLLPQAGITAQTTQYALLTDSTWRMINASALDLSTTTIGFTANTAIFGGFGSYNSVTSAITLNAIPEPSSASLLALGMAGLVALRLRRKN